MRIDRPNHVFFHDLHVHVAGRCNAHVAQFALRVFERCVTRKMGSQLLRNRTNPPLEEILRLARYGPACRTSKISCSDSRGGSRRFESFCAHLKEQKQRAANRDRLGCYERINMSDGLMPQSHPPPDDVFDPTTFVSLNIPKENHNIFLAKCFQSLFCRER